MLHSLESQFALLVLLLTCAFAFTKGGAAERWGAAFILLSWLGGDGLSLLLRNIFSAQILEFILLGMDALLAVSLLGLAFRFAKLWLGFAMMLQSGELALHGAVMGDWGFKLQNYIYLNNMLSFGLLLLMAGATFLTWRRSLKWVSSTVQSGQCNQPDLTVPDSKLAERAGDFSV